VLIGFGLGAGLTIDASLSEEMLDTLLSFLPLLEERLFEVKLCDLLESFLLSSLMLICFSSTGVAGSGAFYFL
jgi:hypothetical protein